MNTKAKRTLALSMTVIMLMAMATACKKPSGEEESSSSKTSSSATSSKKAEEKKWDNPLDDPAKKTDYQVKVPTSNKEEMEKIKKEAKDTVAYLEVPGTTIKDAVVQTDEKTDRDWYAANNEYYYERKDMYGNYLFEGCYFMDYECNLKDGKKDSMPQNTLIYGHNIGNPKGVTDDPNGIKFAQLLKFEDPEFAKQHPYIYLTTPGEDLVYQIFAVVFSEAAMEPMSYIASQYDKTQFKQLIDDVRARSYLNYPDITITEKDKIITLSTCCYKEGTYAQNNQQRFIVFGRLVKGQNFAETVNVTVNPSPKKPTFK